MISDCFLRAVKTAEKHKATIGINAYLLKYHRYMYNLVKPYKLLQNNFCVLIPLLTFVLCSIE